MRKQLDSRIPTLIRNKVSLNQRSFFCLIGDKGRDQIVNLHFLLSQSRVDSRPSILWCYKKDLGFTTHRKKRESKIKRDIKRGIRDKNDSLDPFELFIGNTEIRYCYYKETEKVLGNTFGMLVLQDFHALTPNLLARTIETIQGGGIVVLLLGNLNSLKQLYSLGMDVHQRYRSSFSPDDPVARFNERFLLSLSSSPDCLFLDDELNVLPISRGKDIRPLEETLVQDGEAEPDQSVGKSKNRENKERELKELKNEIGTTKLVGKVVKETKTLDQAKAVLSILEVLSSSSLSTTIALTASRGRGKSASLGLSISAAVAYGYSNIFVTSPSPENLRTLFEFLFKGLTALGYDEVSDWDLQRGTGEWKDLVLRVNIFKENKRQTIQYIQPSDSHVLGQAELLVIDEAAAIPLPLVQDLLGNYTTILSSTINGYEGTGRSLSLKLIQQLRQSSGNKIQNSMRKDDSLKSSSSSSKKASTSSSKAIDTGSRSISSRNLKEISLNEPIRYSSGDQIESWLHELLCLDASLIPLSSSALSKGCPHPSSCTLYQVNRDALFSYHPASEIFLQRMMALYVSSHYKNSPNDLQLMSDAPSHRLFVLLPPLNPSSDELPQPLAVLQVSLEGNISRQSILNSLSRGQRDAGDLIPWTLSQQFQDTDFASLSGARIVRIATHPDYVNMGYGNRCIEALREFYEGHSFDLQAMTKRLEREKHQEKEETLQSIVEKSKSEGKDGSLLKEEIFTRDVKKMPALLTKLNEIKPESLDWLGVSYGLTPSLFKFWKRLGFTPLYLRQSANDLTGEYTCIQLKTLRNKEDDEGDEEVEAGTEEFQQSEWLGSFALDFRRRFIQLLGFKFSELKTINALNILEAANHGIEKSGVEISLLQKDDEQAGAGAGEGGQEDGNGPIKAKELRSLIGPFDFKRLESYSNNMLELSVILDLIPTLSNLYFNRRIVVNDSDSDDADEAGAGAGEGGGSSLQQGRNSLSIRHQQKQILTLSGIQAALLLAIGAQRKQIEDISRELNLPVPQALSIFVKSVRKITQCLRDVEKNQISKDLNLSGKAKRSSQGKTGEFKKLDVSLDEELKLAGEEDAHQREEKSKLSDPMLLDGEMKKYSLQGDNRDWSEAEEQVRRMNGVKGANTTVSVKTTLSAEELAAKESGLSKEKRKVGNEKFEKGGKKLRR